MGQRSEIFKETIEKYLGDGISFPTRDISILRGPCVYVYTIENLPVYVGHSQNGILRALDKRHSSRMMRLADEILIYPAKDLSSAKKAEQVLITELNPQLNKKGISIRHG
jgi:hypothetical protein